jgi:hypothetical protein
MMKRVAASTLDHTRALILAGLGIRVNAKVGDAYRDPSGTPLEGEWIGAFAQPGVVLNAVTAVSAQIAEGTGGMEDEYGKSKLVVTRKNDRVTIEKHYQDSHFIYIGKLFEGALAGYWYAPIRPAFGGVFWLSRADRLREDSLEQFRARVRSKSPRRTIAKGMLWSLAIGSAVGLRMYPPLAIGSFAAFGGFSWVMNRRVRAMRVEIERWKRELGGVSGSPAPAG